MAFSRKSYSGPMKNRGEVMRGGKKLANVSKEELDDFRAKFGKDKTLKDLLNADRSPKTAPKAEAPKAEAPKAEAPKKSTIDTMRDTTARKYDKDRLEEAKKTATPEPESKPTPRGRMKAAGRNRSEETESPMVNVPEGGTAVERMKKMREARFGKKSGGSVKSYKSGGSVSKRADGCATKGKTKGRMI